jgi:excisionase family DNA binding protein
MPNAGAPPPAEEPCLSVTDSARFLGCSPRTVERKVKEGKLRAYRRGWGRETWIPVADLERLREYRSE